MAAYQFICSNYEPGDDIFLIGYSRGAFAVRCIVNLVHEIGLLTKVGLGSLHAVYDCWWNDQTRERLLQEHEDLLLPENWHPRPHPSPHFIKACGLWDTVNSVGRAGIFGPGSFLGIRRDGPPLRVAGDGAEIGGVDNVYHALSLHESRSRFQPVMARLSQQAELNLEQCWFSGYHPDIGGGRPDDVLAHSPLAWMMAKLAAHIEFDFRMFWKGENVTREMELALEAAGKFAPDLRPTGIAGAD